MEKIIYSKEYLKTLSVVKEKILVARQKAVLSINKELLLLYWDIGNLILEKQQESNWGSKITETLSKDIKSAFPNIKGFSNRNLIYMRKFAQEYKEIEFVQQVVAQLSWSHNIVLMEKITDMEIRKWYIQKNIENGWSRNILINQIESGLYKRQTNKKITNFNTTLPDKQSELANETIKDPYIFDFITLEKDYKEKDLEQELVKHITKFLIELGAGFAFVGQQYHLEISNKDYFIDLLFYHIKLKCYVAIELKIGEFKPEYAGKLNFYLSALDSILKSSEDNPSIGIILCKNKDEIIAEYSLKDIAKPIGVSEYNLVESIPENLKSSLPTIEEIEKSLKNKLK